MGGNSPRAKAVPIIWVWATVVPPTGAGWLAAVIESGEAITSRTRNGDRFELSPVAVHGTRGPRSTVTRETSTSRGDGRDARWLRGPIAWWFFIAVALSAVVPPFFSWPELPMPPGAREEWTAYWERVVRAKIVNPWHDYTVQFEAGSNEAKRNFRVTMPLLARVTGADVAGVHAWRFALQGVLLGGIALAALRASRGDRGMALAATISVAATYVGTSVWRDISLWFDNCAHAFVAVALVATTPWVALPALLLAAFTDERALLVCPLVMLFHAFTGGRRALIFALAATLPVYALIRFSCAQRLSPGVGLGGVGELEMLAINLKHAPLGYWFALEGGWIFIVAAAFGAAKSWHWRAGLLVASIALPVLAATGVGDFTRSATFAFPGTLAALALLRTSGSALPVHTLRRLAFVAAGVSLLAPTVLVMRYVIVEQSVPVRWMLDAMGVPLGR